MFEIQTVDIRGVPTKVFVNAPPSLRAIWEMSAAFADRVYLVYEQGLSVANNALKIEYALTRNVTLRAEAGIISGFGIYYTNSFE